MWTRYQENGAWGDYMRRLNQQLLLEVGQAITAEPHLFSMEDYYVPRSQGATACIAARSLILAGRNPRRVDVHREARKILGISRREAHGLFSASRWPKQFRQQYVPEPSSARELRRNARVAAQVITHFLATHS